MKKKLYFLTLLFCYGVSAQTPKLVSDLIGNAYRPNKPMINVNGIIYFRANDGVYGEELWKTDGTSAGTVMIKDIYPSSNGSRLNYFANIGNTVYFAASDPVNGNELWKTSGTTASTVLVKNIVPNSDGSFPRELKNFNSTLYFSANSGELWKSDGTEAGTVLIKVFPVNNTIQSIIPGINTLFFTVDTPSGAQQLWKTNGTEGGTIILREFVSSTYAHITFNNELYFAADDGISGSELWKSDGTIANTKLVKDINEGPFGSGPGYLTVFNGFIYFSVYGNIYKSNGTEAGTTPVSSLDGYYLTNVNGALYFVDFENEYTVYKYNGTTFTLLRNFARYDNASPYITFFGLADGSVFFTAKEQEHGDELWKTDGTPAGTVITQDLRPGIQGSFPGNFIIDDGSIIYFLANDDNTGFEIWKKAGNANMTLVKDVEPNNFDGNPYNLAKLNNFLFFGATDQYSTHLFAVNNNNSSSYAQSLPGKNPSDFLAFNNLMYFSGEYFNGRELLMSDGVNSTQIKDIYTGTGGGGIQNSSNPTELTAVGSSFYFAATNLGDRELWKSNGTDVGTVLVKNINATGNSSPNHLIEFNGNLYFFANAGSATNLYESDGTSVGTVAIGPSNYTVDPINGEIARTSTKLYVQAFSSTSGEELFYLAGSTLTLLKDINAGSSGGTPLSSNPSNFTPVSDRLYFTADDGINGTELWKTDGTLATTTIVKDIKPGNSSPNINNLIKFNTNLFFSADDGINGQELWKSDGTPQGTLMIKDIVEGNGSSNPKNFCVVGNTLYFSAYHPRLGTELWKTDGTAGGTVLVYNLNDENDSELNDANPTQLINMNGTLYFAADNGLNGNELFNYKPCPLTGSFNQYTFAPSYTYHAVQTIEAYHKITQGRTLNYFAGNSVLLTPGFSVSANDAVSTRNNVFRAEARGCN
ncbi:ELWxxDGT repeat protein [Emticicia sp. C21]|uniref:ELWxxDGT repeat protein n=1 Tax=Emticicia sp. C21 TaxID=2302915 RepID=UPI000E3473AF|nr:ELWxxDGT repeat protein [Emticicia sp. C21]RFS14159.1 hypothetical protein D0T08_23230 [Emticicia sp. C21]